VQNRERSKIMPFNWGCKMIRVEIIRCTGCKWKGDRCCTNPKDCAYQGIMKDSKGDVYGCENGFEPMPISLEDKICEKLFKTDSNCITGDVVVATIKYLKENITELIDIKKLSDTLPERNILPKLINSVRRD